MMLCIVALG